MSWTKRNIVPKKLFKVGDMIECVITEIDKDKEELQFLINLLLKIPIKV